MRFQLADFLKPGVRLSKLMPLCDQPHIPIELWTDCGFCLSPLTLNWTKKEFLQGQCGQDIQLSL